MSNLHTASRQWANRPDDERFVSIDALYQFCREKRERSRQATVNIRDLQIGTASAEEEVILRAKNGKSMEMTNWAFRQFCARLGAPFDWCTQIPATLAVANLQFAKTNNLTGHDPDRMAKLLLHRMNEDGDLRIVAFNGAAYARIWDYEVVDRLRGLSGGWKVPAARTTTFSGAKVTSSGLYAGDHDCFIFMVNEENRIKDGTDEGLGRGFFLSNSEVGAAAWGLTAFLYRYVCGNHIVWGAKNIERISIRHVGDANAKSMEAFNTQINDYAQLSAKDDEAAIRAAKQFSLGGSDGEVEDTLFDARLLARRTIREALQLAPHYESIDGSPWSAWGMSNVLTRMSQREVYAEKRIALDQAAGKVLAMASGR